MTVVFSRAFFLSASIIEGIEGFSALGAEGVGVEGATVLLATGLAICYSVVQKRFKERNKGVNTVG
jgi:hypothetical protein